MDDISPSGISPSGIYLSGQDVAERSRAAGDGHPPKRAPVHPGRRWRVLSVFAVLAIIAAVGGQQVWHARQLPPASP